MSSAAEFLPPSRSLKALEAAAEGCRGCELYKDATQVVFGQGRKSAELMLVGEQPGDKEDKAGEPFVGPAEAPFAAFVADLEGVATTLQGASR
jgi:uracil-DNA glycosylase